MEGIKEDIVIGYPNLISYECTKKILEQMEKNVCKIKIGQKQGTGLICKIPFPDKNNMLSVFITNNHIINKDFLYKDGAKIQINIRDNLDSKEINLNERMKYTNEEYNTTIIEIKESDDIKNYLELDEILINDILNNKNNNKELIDKTIYLMQYPEGELSVSFGILHDIYEEKKYNFIHKCSTRGGSSGSPILNLNNKLIGIHKEGIHNKYNIGTFLNYPIKEFISLNYNNNNANTKNGLNKIKDNDENETTLKAFNDNDLNKKIFKNLRNFNK